MVLLASGPWWTVKFKDESHANIQAENEVEAKILASKKGLVKRCGEVISVKKL